MGDNFKVLQNLVYQKTCTMPLVDAHMHIQGNDIAPIPIMKGVLYSKANLSKILFGSGKINFEELSFLEPNNTVDPTPGILAGGPKLGDILLGLVSIFTFWQGERQRLTDLTATIMDYGKVARHPSYLSSGVYMNEIIKSTMGMASHTNSRELSPKEAQNKAKESEKERTKLVSYRKGTTGEFQDTARHYYLLSPREGSLSVGASFQFSLCMGMELMYAHYWGAYGIPIYIPINDKLYFPINEMTLHIPDLFSRRNGDDTVWLHHAYDIPNESIRNSFEIWENGRRVSQRNDDNILALQDIKAFDTSQVGVTEKYSHFLSEVDEREAWQFEDHVKHVNYMRMAALKYPFRILPFYHLDARRFFSPSDAETLERNHDFYIQKNTKIEKIQTRDIADALKDGNKFQYRMDIESTLKKDLIDSGGVFWGVKLYMALGYPPYIGEGEHGKKPFPALKTDSYSEFKRFLVYCSEKDIPVTVHGSPQGMTIADPGVYLKEYLKQKPDSKYGKNKKAHFPIDGKAFSNGLGLIDSFSSPYSWSKVLNDGSLSELRICLAHFGGMGFMDGELDLNKSPYKWNEDISKLISGALGCKAQVYTDLSCYTMAEEFAYPEQLSPYHYNKISKLAGADKMYEEKEYREVTVYERTGWDKDPQNEEDLKHSIALKFKLVEEGLCGDAGKINKTAETLKQLIDDYGALRTRIMFGTDWPMTETSVKGVSRYNSAMFMMLALLTKKLGNKWDAWHQFAVINPLAFMGIIDEKTDDDENTVFPIKMDKLNKLKTNLMEFNKTVEGGKYRERKAIWELLSVEEDEGNIDTAFKSMILGIGDFEKGYYVNSSKSLKNDEFGMFITHE